MSGYDYDVFGKTHVGKRRAVNQDTFLLDTQIGLFLVADGMGGHNAGDTASRLAADHLSRNFKTGFTDTAGFLKHESCNQNFSDLANTMRVALERTNERVRRKGMSAAEYKGMGTTLAAVCLNQRRLICANVGDSPIFLVQSGRVFPLFMPHTVQGEKNSAQSSDAARFADKYPGVLTRALGGNDTVEPYICEIPVCKGDGIVLCTDGLSKKVTGDEIAQAVQRYSAKKACSALMDMANARGGDDNITVVVLKIEERRLPLPVITKLFFPFKGRLKTDK